MSVRHGLAWVLTGALSFGLAGCAQSSETVSSAASSAAASSAPSNEQGTEGTLSVLCPTGAPALASLGLAEQGAQIEYVEGQDLLVSELSKTDGDYDMIIAPVNVGVKTWKDAGAYQLDGILTWGNLYIISQEEDWNQEGQTIALFGENAVPGMVFTSLYPDVKANMEYYPSVAEASAALLSGKANSAMLAQPAAAGALSKGADAGLNLMNVDNLQTAWKDAHETDQNGYPQAALFVRKGAGEKYRSWVDSLSSYIDSATAEKIEADVDAFGAERLGVPSAKLAASTWQEQNIHYVSASQAQSDLEKFLNLFSIEIPDGLIAE